MGSEFEKFAGRANFVARSAPEGRGYRVVPETIPPSPPANKKGHIEPFFSVVERHRQGGRWLVLWNPVDPSEWAWPAPGWVRRSVTLNRVEAVSSGTSWVVMRSISMIFFERDLEDTDFESVVEDWLEKIAQGEPAGKYSVVLHNDETNGLGFVTRVIHAVFGYGMRKSTWPMPKAHFTGRSSLWVGASAEAEQERNEMTAHGPDPNMLHKGARPLSVTVEI